MSQLEEYAANAPDIDGRAVDLRAKQNLWSAVPESNNFVSVTLERQSERSGETEVSDFHSSFLLINQQIAGFEVAVHDAALVTMQQRFKHLFDDCFGLSNGEGLSLFV